ncbi:hypothetical protein ERS043847_01866, partial [Streptococcus pneumoniae]
MEASVPVFGNCCLDLPAEADVLADVLALVDADVLADVLALVEADVLAEADALVDADVLALV